MRALDATDALHSILALATVALVAGGCAGADGGGAAGDGSANGPSQQTGVGQAGAQDFGRFRGLVESGELPSPETLDAVGFFNEHKFELPKPDCGEDVCLHGMFGVQGNMINGSNCTTVAIGFNTKRKPDSFKRPPLNMAIAVDVSGSMAGGPLQSVREGLKRMAGKLRAEDRVTLVAYSSEAEVVVESKPNKGMQTGRSDLLAGIDRLQTRGSTNLYRGLSKAYEVVERNASEKVQNRVMILSDGKATAGIQRRDRIVNLARAYTEKSYGLTAIGIGDDFDLELMRQLGRGGANNFYFLEDPSSVREVFVEEVQTFLVPLAEEVEIRFEGTSAYQFRAAYGTRDWTGDRSSATIEIPALFMASRQSTEDIGPGGGRRGGGGIILLELVPTTDAETLSQTPPGSEVGNISMTYRDPQSGHEVRQNVGVSNPLAPDAAPEEGEFTNGTVEKAFVALNIYAGFRMATDRASRGAAGAALDVLEPLRDNVREWLDQNPDADIRADLDLMNQLIALIREQGDRAPRRVGQTPNPWPRD